MKYDEAKSLVQDWNDKYPVGTEVVLTNDLGKEEHTATRSIAWVIPCGEPLVSVKGGTTWK